jgi:hypothetical protein
MLAPARAGSHSRLSPDGDSIQFFDGMTQCLQVFSLGAPRLDRNLRLAGQSRKVAGSARAYRSTL